MRKNPTGMTAARLALVLLGAAMLGACEPATGPDERQERMDAHGTVVQGTGTIVWVNLEGGFFAIRGDDRNFYLPSALPPSLRSAPTRVRFVGTIDRETATTAMFGTLVILDEIERL